MSCILFEFVHVQKVMNNEDYGSTILEYTDTLHLLYGTCQQILWEGLNLWQIPTKFVH